MQAHFDFYENIQRSAELSDCQNYRYSLQREWSRRQKKVLIIGLNPSTADHQQDDPTIRRCIRFAQSWGFGGVSVANLFAYRSTDPRDLKAVGDPIGPENDAWIVRLAQSSDLVVAAWGNGGDYLGRSAAVRELCESMSVIKLNRSGHPAHPLYLRSDLVPIPWSQ